VECISVRKDLKTLAGPVNLSTVRALSIAPQQILVQYNIKVCARLTVAMPRDRPFEAQRPHIRVEV